MEIVISKTDKKASFAGDQFFEETEVPAMKKFAESCGYIISVTKTNDSFCNSLNPMRRNNVRAIDWHSPSTYRIVLKGIDADKDDIQIAESLGCPDSGYAVRLKLPTILRTYKKWIDLDNGKLTEKRFADLCVALAR